MHTTNQTINTQSIHSAPRFVISENVARIDTVNIGGVTIRRDAEGRYSLNDLHKSAVESKKATDSQRPGNFLKSESVAAFIGALETATKIAVCVKLPGRAGGTFADELIAIRYAAWIEPAFEVDVYRTFQSVKRSAADSIREGVDRAMSRERARLEAPALTDAITHGRIAAGKEVKHYHFSNEFDLINRIALGMPSKAYRAAHCIGPAEAIRDHLTPCEIRCIEHLQRVNASLIDIGTPYEARKEQLSKVYMLRHSRALLSEIKRLEF
ncbi:hypothetical protein M2401_000837 [Pseudomonas sp. JUb42]|uniref:KilA-N domain-containing protein n=1 Tax=Pseudomonas sp. JUb42 TaxID=2940611 RepID=UPI00216780C0|nr:KilA-N domain-containing protein [Pseudomonas sp. JUb42]MCS3467116.1 hypothetical protein [Pseudomonas sp. JUb42]